MQIAFINNEDLWISVDSVDTDNDREGRGTGLSHQGNQRRMLRTQLCIASLYLSCM